VWRERFAIAALQWWVFNWANVRPAMTSSRSCLLLVPLSSAASGILYWRRCGWCLFSCYLRVCRRCVYSSWSIVTTVWCHILSSGDLLHNLNIFCCFWQNLAVCPKRRHLRHLVTATKSSTLRMHHWSFIFLSASSSLRRSGLTSTTTCLEYSNVHLVNFVWSVWSSKWVKLFQNNYQQDDTYGLSFISGLVVLHSTCFELQGAHHQDFTFSTLYRQSLVYCIIFVLFHPFSYVFCSVPDKQSGTEQNT